MEFTETREINREGFYAKQYSSDQPLNIDAIIDILKKYQTEEAVLFTCDCLTYTEEGHSFVHSIKSVDDLKQMHDFPNPSIIIHAHYVDPNTMGYKYTISTAANTRSLEFSVNQSINEYINKKRIT